MGQGVIISSETVERLLADSPEILLRLQKIGIELWRRKQTITLKELRKRVCEN